MKAYFFLFNSH